MLNSIPIVLYKMTDCRLLGDNNLQNAIVSVQEETVKLYHQWKQRTMGYWELDFREIP